MFWVLTLLLLSPLRRKLLEKMEYSNKAKADEEANLERKRQVIKKDAAKKQNAAGRKSK